MSVDPGWGLNVEVSSISRALRAVPTVRGAALCLGGLCVCAAPAALGGYVSSGIKPPPITREFRGVWIASVGNIDWPSAPGLTARQQKDELLAMLDCASARHLNAVILQIRPGGDALYQSAIEPWSEYLTGRMGQAPEPFYDPLAFAVAEAHRRNLELHAWFNPYRVRAVNAKSPAAANHLSRAHSTWVRRYGPWLWLDPGEAGVQAYLQRVVLDVTRRYDIDGIHFDDYFYPYSVNGPNGRPLEFPDASSWNQYQKNGGRLARDDWRRENVNGLVRKLYEAIRAEKRWVKFGISPFGIWRPGYPPQIKGHDAFGRIYADSRKWLVSGWVDYLTPQLYWDISAPEQSYPVLLKWWAEQNVMQRHLWPGNSISGVGAGRRSVQEVLQQVRHTRQQKGAGGNIFWHIKPLLQDKAGIGKSLEAELYTEPALVPASRWLDRASPPTPSLSVAERAGGVRVNWKSGPGESAWVWVLQTRWAQEWRVELLPGEADTKMVKGRPAAVALTGVDRVGNASAPIVLALQADSGS